MIRKEEMKESDKLAWGTETCLARPWIVIPVFLIPKVLEKIRRERVSAIVVIPEIKRARWSPLLQKTILTQQLLSSNKSSMLSLVVLRKTRSVS